MNINNVVIINNGSSDNMVVVNRINITFCT